MDTSVQSFGDVAMNQAMTGNLGANVRSMANIDKTSQDFEAMFMTQMLQPMFEGLGVDPTFGGGHAEEIMRTFMLQEYGRIAAKSGRLGIAAEVKSEMIKAQAAATNKSNAKTVQNTAGGSTNASVE